MHPAGFVHVPDVVKICTSGWLIFASPAALTMLLTVNPLVWVTGVVPSVPRMTVHVVPVTFVTSTISVGAAGSCTRNCVPAAVVTAGNVAEDATVHDSDVPAAGAVVPPLETVVELAFANRSTATYDAV